MIRAGLESLIHEQLNDWIIPELNNLYVSLEKVFGLYYEKKTISRKDYERDFDKIVNDFEKTTTERFGFRVTLRASTTFAIMPIFNTDTLKASVYSVNSFNKDVNHSIKQLKTFKKDLVNGNDITIDLVKAKVYGLSKDTYFPLFIHKHMIYSKKFDLTNFITIMLHEIGHVFTLLEMFTSTNKAITSLADNLILNNDIDGLISDLNITADRNLSSKDKVVKVYDTITGDLGKIQLANGRVSDNTDIEFEADNFVAKFGYGGDLIKTLNKLVGVNENERIIVIIFSLYYLTTMALFNLILITFSINPISIFLLLGIFTVIDIVSKITRLSSISDNRNPSNGEHGDFLTRYKRSRSSMIAMLRNYTLDKTELKSLINQIDTIDKEIAKLDKSLFNSYFGSLMHESLGVNLNLRDKLATLVDNTINNDLHLMSGKFKAGLEAKDFMDTVGVVYTEVKFSGMYDNSRYFASLLKIKKNTVLLNKVLAKYNYEVRYVKDEKSLGVKSNEIITIASGISGFAMVPKVVTKDTAVVSVTLESEKVIWLLENPYIHVYNIDVIKVNDIKYIYVMEMEHISILGITNRSDKILTKIWDKLNKHHEDYGESDASILLDIILDIKLPKVLHEQFVLLKKLVNDLDITPQLDLHGGNIGTNNRDELVLLDPIFNQVKVGLKQNNYVELNLTKLSDKE